MSQAAENIFRPARLGAGIWFTGLPGAGKSTVVKAVLEVLRERGVDAFWLQMDARRKHYVPNPTYSIEERRLVYRMFVEEAAAMVDEGRIVLMDGSGPELGMRKYARARMARFAEVHLKCSVFTAMKREAARPEGMVMAGLYAKAMKRKATGQEFPGLGQVIGIDVLFEEDPAAELTLDAEHQGTAAKRDAVLARFAAWWG